MNEIASWFYSIDEPYAGALFEMPERSRFYRIAYAQKKFWEQFAIPPYAGGQLFPNGPKFGARYAVFPDYSYSYQIDDAYLAEKGGAYAANMVEEQQLTGVLTGVHTVGGNGYTHSIPNYGRLLREGLDGYRQRVLAMPEGEFRDGLLLILDGIAVYHRRCLQMLEQANAPEALQNALRQVPFQPPRTLYEALVAWNFLYYVDGCDNPGRMDAELIGYYNGEDMTDVFREFFRNADANEGWSSALGPDYNPLTLQILTAIRGIRRPSLELRVTEQMPDDVWTAAAKAIESGCGQPAFYNEEMYQTQLALQFPDIPKSDLLQFNGGGCTETMLAGCSNVGSLDGGFNLAYVFRRYLCAELANAKDFSDFYLGFMDVVRREVGLFLDDINAYRARRAKYRPHPLRTLLIDDCIERGLDYNAGGARYMWSVVNVAGMINVADSLLAIRKLVFDSGKYTPADFLVRLDTQDAALLRDCKACPCVGVENAEADLFAAGLAKGVYDTFQQRKPYLGRAFLPSSIQFTTYADAGKCVGATPDGRAAGDPLCDCIGAVHGKDNKGATAYLNSAAKLPQAMALGTPVLNLKLRRQDVTAVLRPLVMGYFAGGGMQLQVSCLSREDMLDALEHPERHENLIVRMGGFSEYFNRLSDELKRSVIARTEHEG